jgi:hypothetical protein
VTQEELKLVVTYDPETGVFRWLASKAGRRAEAGTVLKPRGYVQLCVDGKRYYAHRLAWLYVHGVWPTNYIDHINSTPSDNRIVNLREATLNENLQNRGSNTNNTSGHLGVSWRKDCARWEARLMVDRKTHHLGLFEHIEDAVAARKTAEQLYHPFRAT